MLFIVIKIYFWLYINMLNYWNSVFCWNLKIWPCLTPPDFDFDWLLCFCGSLRVLKDNGIWTPDVLVFIPYSSHREDKSALKSWTSTPREQWGSLHLWTGFLTGGAGVQVLRVGGGGGGLWMGRGPPSAGGPDMGWVRQHGVGAVMWDGSGNVGWKEASL